jgi:hypothetical protein
VLFNRLNHKQFQTMLELVTFVILQLSAINFNGTTDSGNKEAVSSNNTITTTTSTSSFDHGVGGWGEGH